MAAAWANRFGTLRARSDGQAPGTPGRVSHGLTPGTVSESEPSRRAALSHRRWPCRGRAGRPAAGMPQ
eukprot:317242-Hanusia_phi.AAC.1